MRREEAAVDDGPKRGRASVIAADLAIWRRTLGRQQRWPARCSQRSSRRLHFANRFLWLSSVIDDVSTVVFPTAFAIFTAVIFGPTQFNMVWEPHPTLVYFNATERDWTLGSAEACGATEYDTVEWAS